MLGTYALSAGYYDAYYVQGAEGAHADPRDFEQAFETCDVIVAPTAPTDRVQARREDRRPAADVPDATSSRSR